MRSLPLFGLLKIICHLIPRKIAMIDFAMIENLPIRVTPDGLYSVYDAIRLFSRKNPYATWKTLLRQKNEYSSVNSCQWFKFPGKRQVETPVNTQKNIIKIIELSDAKTRKEYANNYKEFPTATEIWSFLENCGDKDYSAFYDEFYCTLVSSSSYKEACNIKYSKELSKKEKIELLLDNPEWGLMVNITGYESFDYKAFFELMGYSEYWPSISETVQFFQTL